MKKTINFYEFKNWFNEHRPNNFSESGLQALWEMLEEYEESTGEEIEFDPIALCCEYTEYEDLFEFWQDYDKEHYPNEDAIMEQTHYWAFGDSFIIQNF
ncbi:MAG: hypothetical protein Unbinned7837contig1000_30 [Prokaryotic dsDNA virus sp.]|nr:MAG: hypothetical protein Unbinned7837contig1000_30 [Prokaryotic dsDNA virus sp.]|tara:strand:- start:11288 stop:11584 length:297 start_codon:yes stop_codon:yes gene_type:complete